MNVKIVTRHSLVLFFFFEMNVYETKKGLIPPLDRKKLTFACNYTCWHIPMRFTRQFSLWCVHYLKSFLIKKIIMLTVNENEKDGIVATKWDRECCSYASLLLDFLKQNSKLNRLMGCSRLFSSCMCLPRVGHFHGLYVLHQHISCNDKKDNTTKQYLLQVE